MEIANGSLEIFAALVIFILLISMYNEKNIDTFDKSLSAMAIIHIIVLLLDATHWFLYQQDKYSRLMIMFSVIPTILSLIGNSIFVYFTIKFLSRRGPIARKITIPLISLFIFAIAVWTIFILHNGISSAATIQTDFVTMRYRWSYWLGHFGWASVCIIGIWIIFQCRKNLKKKELWALLSYCFFPLIALILRSFWDGSQIFLSNSLSLIWIYAVMQRGQRQRMQENENELTESRMTMLISQLQPHFMYNTLTTICGLCDENPKEAKNVTAFFADYLRQNLNSLNQRKPIPFIQELEHTKVYLYIEKKRFEDKLNIDYNIGPVNFNIPSLTIQVLVENSVKHGITKSKNGGTITISTTEKNNYYEVIIKDNGVGFDSEQVQEDTNNLHVGLENVRTRLWMMCRGTLTLESIVGQGTKVYLKIPKGDVEDEDYCSR